MDIADRSHHPRLIRFAATALLLLLTLGTGAQTKALDRLNDDARRAARKGQTSLADSLFMYYTQAYDELGLGKGYDYSEALVWLARRAAQQGQIDRAIAMQKEVADIRRTAKDCNYALWAAAMSDLASFYSQKGDYTSAINTGLEAADMMKKKFGENHHYYSVTLANLASYYSARGQSGDYDEAVRLGEASLKHIKHGTPEYANALNALVVFYTQAGNRFEANRLSAKARKEARKRLKEDGAGYATVLNNQAIRLANAGNYEEAVAYAQTARESFTEAGATQTLAYSKLLSNMGTFYAHLQKYQEAAQVLEEALPIIEHVTSRHHPDYVRCISDLSSVYKSIGNLDRADQLAHESERISLDMGEQDNLKYARSLSKQAATFASNGNYTRAIEHEKKALRLFTARHDTTAMAFSLGALANYLFNDGQHQKGINTATQALQLFSRRGEKSIYYAQSLNNAAILHFNNQNYEQASDYGRQALDMYRLTGDTVNTMFARIMANNGLFAYMNDSVGQAQHTTQKAIELNQRLLGKDHPDNVPLLYNLAVYQMRAGLQEQAERSYAEALHLQAQTVRTNFLHLTSQEREKFWNQKSYVFRFAPMLAYKDSVNSNMVTEAYNSVLFTKGILLNSDIDFKNLLRRTGDEQLLEKYNKIDMLRQSEEDYFRLPIEQRNEAKLKQMREEKYQLERALVRGCKEYGSFTENLDIDASQIAQALQPDEAAIEFADIYIHGMGTTYLALLLTHDSPQPRLLRLFSEEDLKDLKYGGGQNFMQAMKDKEGINQIYNDPRFGSMLWGPLMKHLEGIRKIYFSPTAMLYQMGIEYMPCDSTQRIDDRFDVYRLSSTKLLARRQDAKPIRTATIYGGLEYDMDLAELRYQHEHLSNGELENLLATSDLNDRDLDYGMQRTLDSLMLRGSVNYLEGTEHEVQNIAEQLMQHDVHSRVLMKQEGTEETFKALSGTNRSLIHIATHGFSYSEQNEDERKLLMAYLNDQTTDLDNTLNYSGLLFSGANYALRGNKVPAGLEDGVLTAREIAQTDLGQVDMVVLSACQTALGEIREDGVFGIQRGFKKAGAHSLMMSLWKVDDKATFTMMTAFYTYLMQGMERTRAFRMAQQDLRSDPETATPYCWASFILLDAF